eukprot:TRINITY_DN11681_c0_g1_i2.p1 TRINITY_DN11681_c0_g1~~TRINITY_DN11681_c0_g1_i2.p1  ORF type:complete len:209 (+),score=15.98 TRINITY_DN11681_c0_g1_i2:202-828(+)
MGCFEILSKEVGVPLVTFALKSKVYFTEYDIADLLKQFGWIVPAYTMAPDLEHVTMLRALVREDFSRSLADRFLNDLKLVVKLLEDKRPIFPQPVPVVPAATIPEDAPVVTPLEVPSVSSKAAAFPDGGPAALRSPGSHPTIRLARDLAEDDAPPSAYNLMSPLAGTRLMPPSRSFLEHSHSMDVSALRSRTFRVFKKNSLAKTNGVC